MILAFDTETTGLIHRDLAHDHPAQPDLVQLGLALYDDDGTERACAELIVKPEGYAIPQTATAVHGIATADALRCGFKLSTVVSIFYGFRAAADRIVAHHLDFDERVIATAAFRAGRPPAGLPINRACTAELAEPVLRLPPTAKMMAAGYGDKHKKPTLAECYRDLFGEKVIGAHSALADARAAARVYFHLAKGGGVLPPPKVTWLGRLRSFLARPGYPEGAGRE